MIAYFALLGDESFLRERRFNRKDLTRSMQKHIIALFSLYFSLYFFVISSTRAVTYGNMRSLLAYMREWSSLLCVIKEMKF